MATLCFDLDGTLVDPLPAIRPCLARVLGAAGIPLPPDEAIRPHIGPGIHGLFRGLPDLPPDRAETLLSAYFRCFHEEGVYLHRVYDGIPLLLDRLKRQGHQLILLTAKPQSTARALAYHLDLHLTFASVHGSDPAGPWRTKREMALDLRTEGILGAEGLFIGDRAGDMEAARALAFRAVGVAYGFGDHGELEAAGAEVILDRVEDLDAWLLTHADAPRVRDPFSHAE